MARTDRKKYNTLISNTLLFAISNFSSKLLSVIVQPYLSYALGDTAVKRQQITELKELVMEIDPNAFVIVQEAHQVLGDGFSRYHRNAL